MSRYNRGTRLRTQNTYKKGETILVEGRTYTFNGEVFTHTTPAKSGRRGRRFKAKTRTLDPKNSKDLRKLEIAGLASGWKRNTGRGASTKVTNGNYTFGSEADAALAAELLYGSKGRVRRRNGVYYAYKKSKGGNLFSRAGDSIGGAVSSIGSKVSDVASSIDDRVTQPAVNKIGDELNDLGGSIDDRVTQPIVDLTEDVGDAAVRASDYLAKELKDQAEFVFVDPIREIKERTEGTVVGRGLDFISENVVDPIDDLKDNPYVQVAAYFVPGVGPILGPSLQIASKLDNGGELTGQDVVNLALSAASVAGTVDPKLIKAGEAAAKVQAGEEPIDVFVQLYAQDVLSALDNPALENGLETAIRTAGGEDLTTALAATYGQDYLRSEEFKSGASQFLSDKGMNQSTIDLIFEQDKGAELFNQVAYGEDPLKAVASLYSKDIAEGLFGEEGNLRAGTIAALKAVPKADDVDFSDPGQVAEFIKGTYGTYKAEGGTLPEFEFTASLFGGGTQTEGEDGEGLKFNLFGFPIDLSGYKGTIDWARGAYNAGANYLAELGFDYSTVFGAIQNPLEFLELYGIKRPEGFNVPIPPIPTPSGGVEVVDLNGDVDLFNGTIPEIPSFGLDALDINSLDVASLDTPSLDLSLPSFDLGLDLGVQNGQGGTSEEEEENKDPNEFQGLDYDANILGNALARIKSLKV